MSASLQLSIERYLKKCRYSMVYGMADSCLYNKQNNTWIYVNTRRYVNSISPRVHLLFSIYRRIRKGQLEYQRAHTIPFRTFLGFPVDTSGLFTLNSFYWGKLHHLILTPTIFIWIVHANGKHPRKQCNALSNNKYVQN